MRLEKLLGIILIAAGLASLLFGIFSAASIMRVLIPNLEEATSRELISFFYASTPQTVLWSITFATFFASGMFLVKASSSECNGQEDNLSGQSFSRQPLETEAAYRDFDARPRNKAEERIQAIKADVLKAIERLEELDRKKME